MAFPTEKELRVSFHKLKAQLEAEQARTEPLRQKMEALQVKIDKLQAEQNEIRAKIKEENVVAYDIQNEMGMIVRALGGQTALQPGDK